ncbi:MAG TPA: DUF2800 domain-containing protein [Solimonas sp.]|nr:DUF2800 domain-containing protein [Solimonas sp.]
MTNRAHSRIGASSLYRWGKCPGSVRESEGMPNQSSVHAAEGTVAHGVAEIMLRRELLGDETQALPAVGSKQTVDGHEIEITQEMIDFVRVYADAVTQVAGKPGALLYVECKFDLSSIHPGMFGTADAVVWVPSERKLVVFDLKYGAGIAVEAEDNQQLQFYAVGALLKTGAKVDTVEIVIAQPRARHEDGAIRPWSTTPLDLVEFAGDLRLKAQATEDPDAPLLAGAWCRFCPAAGKPCPKLREQVAEIAASSFQPVVLADADAVVPKYDPEALNSALRGLPQLKAYIDRVERFAFFEALQGRGSPGHKLVAKRPQREWRNPALAAQMLQLEYGLTPSEMHEAPTPPALLSPAQMEKLIGLRKADRAEFDKHVEKKSSGVKLAPIEDRGEAVTREALSAFSSIEIPQPTDE